MTDWAPKRFWSEARAEPVDGGHTVRLDGRAVKTPARAPLVVPTLPLAEAIAAEWQAQGEAVDPRTMPFTRSANAAIDKVTPQFAEVADLIAAYADSDLLCYRALSPAALVARQAAGWDPLLDWVAEALEAPLKPVQGVVHQPQDAASLRKLDAAVRALSAFELTAFHDLVSLSGSLVIGLAAIHDRAPLESLWRLSRIDEDWQREIWGADEEAAAAESVKQAAFLHAGQFFELCRGAPF
ncbi:MAG: ATPase [Rhodobacteraceae bacterium]|nr:ATPase [Paracoccaceae bacterium]